ncbi:gamma-glutamylcyclotransferase [Agrobacterium rubi]|nr:gamma-glutamylcyclotransferase [Agrobacterium rubi]NTF24587.1 gamma-glutamylcyclotransferase [Agrobacterium rubi]
MLVFAYGSLLWHPGFKPRESVGATVIGWQRRWCVQSTVHRGTEEVPGAVLGLVEGGRCSGLLYSVESCDCRKVAEYLEFREMAEKGYRPEMIDVATSSGVVRALTYVSDPSDRLDVGPEKTLQIILRAHGVSGANVEYAARTFQALQHLGIGLCEQEAGFPREIVMTILKTRAITRTVRTIARTIDNNGVNLPEAETA